MKKNFLFSLMAIALAAFSFVGVSLADDFVAQIVGGQGYATLQAAVDATKSGDVVRLLSDITNERISISGKTLTLDLSGYMINPSTAGTIIDIKRGSIVTIMGTGTIQNNINGDHLTLAAHDAGTNVTILNGNYYSVSTGNTALIFVYDLATITIKGGNYTGTKAGSGGKDGKVFYAGASNNESGFQNRYGTLIIEGGSFDGRISNSNWGHYVVRGGTFTKNEVVYYDNSKVPCVNENRTISFAEAGFLDEGYVITQDGEQWVVSYDPVATIGEKGYSTVTGAIAAAAAGQTVEIVKAGTYTLPNLQKNITIKGSVDGVIFAHNAQLSGNNIANVPNGATFENITFDLTEPSSDPYYHGFGYSDISTKVHNTEPIIFRNCVISGEITTYGKTEFYNTIFNITKDKSLWNVWVRYGNVSFEECEFNGYDRNIHIHSNTDAAFQQQRWTINVNKCEFGKKIEKTKKAAVIVKEIGSRTVTKKDEEGYGYPTQYNVNISDSKIKDGDDSKYGEGMLGGSKLYMVDFAITGANASNPGQYDYIEDAAAGRILSGTLEGGNVVVTLDGAKVYSTPKRGQTWTVTFDGSGVNVADGAKVAKPTDPSRSCYRFNGWYNENTAYNFDAVVTSGLTLTSSWTYICGGGSSSSSSNKTSNKTGSNNTGNNNTGTNNTGVNNTGTVDTGTNNNEETVTPTDPQAVQENGYTKEFNDAYDFAFANGITTMKNIEEAAMEDGLTRIAMAKMLSQYAINVLKKTPDTSKECKFSDVSEELDAQYDHGVTLACQLGIMGVGITEFRPDDLVVRAEFGTALSRLLFGLADGEDAYYTTHLAKLKEAGIISNDDPSLEELRGYVMLMLMRSAK